MKTIFISTLTLLLFVIQPTFSNNEEVQNLDGTKVTYTYQDLGTVEVTFYNGLLKYKWITGGYAGTEREDFNYKAREIGKKMYLIQWLQPTEATLVTLVIDFKKQKVYSSALLNPKTENETALFHDAIINEQHLVVK